MGGERQKIQLELAFSAEGRGEAPRVVDKGTEPPGAMRGTESPASSESLMEEVVEGGNLKRALRRVQANKGSPGVDGMRVDELPGYLKKHWPEIRQQLLVGNDRPQPVRRV